MATPVPVPRPWPPAFAPATAGCEFTAGAVPPGARRPRRRRGCAVSGRHPDDQHSGRGDDDGNPAGHPEQVHTAILHELHDGNLKRFPAACRGAQFKEGRSRPGGYGEAVASYPPMLRAISGGHAFMLAGHNALVMRQPVTQAKRGGAGPAYVRTRRPGPAPRPGFATGCAALAGLGFGVSVGTVVIGEPCGSLAAPGGLLTAAGRLAGFTGA